MVFDNVGRESGLFMEQLRTDFTVSILAPTPPTLHLHMLIMFMTLPFPLGAEAFVAMVKCAAIVFLVPVLMLLQLTVRGKPLIAADLSASNDHFLAALEVLLSLFAISLALLA